MSSMMMLPQQLASTAASFTRASSLVLKVGTDAHLYDDPHDADIVTLLDSRFDLEKIEALKRLLALMSQGCDVSSFFPQVVKSVASTNLEVKKLVYIYIVHYADKHPDEALLSINTFQKDLVDFNPLVRAWALRAMSGIHVHAVAPLLLMAIKKCAKDPSPYVRRCAANAIPKLHALDNEQYHDTLVELVAMLLDDMSAGVIGVAVSAFISICPEQLTLVAPRFQSLCESLLDVEEWSQVLLIDVLLRYVVARHGLGRHHGIRDEETKTIVDENASLGCETDEVKLLLHTVSPLLHSHNSAVVMAAAGVYWLMAHEEELKKIIKPLLFLLRSSFDSQSVIMANLATFAQSKPNLFEDFYEDFFIRPLDIDHIRAMKLEILSTIARESSVLAIMRELMAYVRDTDRRLAAHAVCAIGKCAKRIPSVALSSMESLLCLVKVGKACDIDHDASNAEKDGSQQILEKSIRERESCGEAHTGNTNNDAEAAVAHETVIAIKLVMQQHSQLLEKVFNRLVRNLDLIGVSAARAVVIWMIGEYGSNSDSVKQMLPTLLRYFAGCFIKEEVEVKLQIIVCMCKIILCTRKAGMHMEEAMLALKYVLDLASCDLSYDLRGRAHMLKKIIDLLSPTLTLEENGGGFSCPPCPSLLLSLPESILLSTKATIFQELHQQENIFLPGSMSRIVHHRAPGYQPLPDPCSLKEPSQSLKGVEIFEDYTGHLAKKQSELDESYRVGEYSDMYSSESTGRSCTDDDGDNELETGNGRMCFTASETTSGSPKPLISLSDDEFRTESKPATTLHELDSPQRSNDPAILNYTDELEAWLCSSSERGPLQMPQYDSTASGFITLSLDILKLDAPKTTLLDFTNGEGLEVKYSFNFAGLEGFQNMVSVTLYFLNRTSNVMSSVSVRGWEATSLSKADDHISARFPAVEGKEKVSVVPLEEIPTLIPHQMLEANLQINFYHQLLPVKLAIHCDGKCFPVKLMPDIGAFLRPKSMTDHTFALAESGLPGMFETIRRCSIRGLCTEQRALRMKSDQEMHFLSRTVASRVLQNVNVSLVSATLPIFPGPVSGDSWHLYLKFAGETLVGPMLCLITIIIQAEESMDNVSYPVVMKVNCEDSLFALNLLKRLDKAVNGIQ